VGGGITRTIGIPDLGEISQQALGVNYTLICLFTKVGGLRQNSRQHMAYRAYN